MSLNDISQIRGPGIHTESHIVSKDITLTGIATASNFKTGSSNVHNVGIEIAGINVLGADTPIGTGATIYDSGAAVFTGVVTASSFSGPIVAGAGNITTTNVQKGLAKVWSNTEANGETLNDSFNVSSLGDSATGQQNINFTNPLSNAFGATTMCPKSNIDQEWEQSKTTLLSNIRAYNGSNYADMGLMIEIAGELA